MQPHSSLHCRASVSLTRLWAVSARLSAAQRRLAPTLLRTPAEPRDSHRPSATQADSLSTLAPCWHLGAGTASGLYIKAAWRSDPAECGVRRESAVLPEVSKPLAMAGPQQQPPYLHLAELTASQFLEIWKHFDADGQ